MEDPPPEDTVEGGQEPPDIEEKPETIIEQPENKENPPESSEDQEEVQVASHMPAPMAESAVLPNSEKGEGESPNARKESLVSYLPQDSSTVLNQLRAADEQARNTMLLMAEMRKSIEKYQEKSHMTESDTRLLEQKQQELLKKLSEFEEITRKMQQLVGMSGTSLAPLPSITKPGEPRPEGGISEEGKITLEGEGDKTRIVSPGKPDTIDTTSTKTGQVDEKQIQVRENDFYAIPEDMLPQLVVCGFANQVPRILICETGDKPKPKPKQQCPAIKPNRQQKPTIPRPQVGHMGQCCCAQEQLRTKENTINLMKKKMCALQSEMRHAVNQNSCLNAQLAQLNQQQYPCAGGNMENALCISECVGNYPSPPKTQDEDVCPSNCLKYVSNNPPQANTERAVCPSRCPPKPADFGKYPLNAVCLQSQLAIIELEVQKMRDDLNQAQMDQQDLDGKRDLLQCAAPKCLQVNLSTISPCACVPPCVPICSPACPTTRAPKCPPSRAPPRAPSSPPCPTACAPPSTPNRSPACPPTCKPLSPPTCPPTPPPTRAPSCAPACKPTCAAYSGCSSQQQ